MISRLMQILLLSLSCPPTSAPGTWKGFMYPTPLWIKAWCCYYSQVSSKFILFTYEHLWNTLHRSPLTQLSQLACWEANSILRAFAVLSSSPPFGYTEETCWGRNFAHCALVPRHFFKRACYFDVWLSDPWASPEFDPACLTQLLEHSFRNSACVSSLSPWNPMS